MDLISRQAAIDIERNATVDTNPTHFEAHQKFTQFMDDAEISSFGRWQWSNGFNTALTAVGIDLKKLPSAQPEQRWIPCSERLPDPGVFVLVSTRQKTGASVVRIGVFPGTSYGWSCGGASKNVVAWMPLPEPYEVV